MCSLTNKGGYIMSTEYEIIVENESPYAQEFYFFQEPAIYSGGAKVYTNSVGHGGLPAKGAGRNQITFTLEQQYYAGAQKQVKPLVLCLEQIEQVSQVPIDLASSSGQTKDSTTLVIDDTTTTLYLSDPVFAPDVQKGAFRIITPSFNPHQQRFNVGLSSINDGKILLSNFIDAQPNKNTDVQPIAKFYVATGTYTEGTVIDFSTSSAKAAKCDATGGKLKFNVTYNADGTWTVN